jgi:uncharacterized protein YcbX
MPPQQNLWVESGVVIESDFHTKSRTFPLRLKIPQKAAGFSLFHRPATTGVWADSFSAKRANSRTPDWIDLLFAKTKS